MERTAAIAWCAGFFEGEGTVVYGASHRGPIVAKVNSTDRDVLELLVARSRVGAVSGPYPPRGFGKKDFFTWVVYGRAAVDFLTEIHPLLGQRRAARVAEKIALWESRPVRRVLATAAVKAAMRRDRSAGMTYADIGKAYGVTTAYAFQICRDGTRAPRRWAVAPAE